LITTLNEQEIPAILSAKQPVVLNPVIFKDPIYRAALYKAATGKEIPSREMSSLFTKAAYFYFYGGTLEDGTKRVGWISRMVSVSAIKQFWAGFEYLTIEISIGRGLPIGITVPSCYVSPINQETFQGVSSSLMFAEDYIRIKEGDSFEGLEEADPWEGSYRSETPRIPSKGGGGASKKAA
jgi:hypothetical protein